MNAYSTPVTSKAQLVEYLERGSKPDRAGWRIGTEHEKFVFYTDTLKPVPYEGERGIGALLDGLCHRLGGSPIEEGGHVIGVKLANGGSITLEPGGQFELSGAPLQTLHQTCAEVNGHLADVRAVAEPLGIGMLGMGFAPTWTLDEIPVMPKGRYRIMRDYMAKVGSLGRDMMFRTCTVQVNLDFASEADMVRKLRVSLALQPVATAIFANSPFREGAPSGMKSYRAHIWTDTDKARTGGLPFVFEDGFGFERYVDYVLDVPMYFVKRDGRYIDVSGRSFRDFMQGRLEGFEGEVPCLSDWEDHMTTVFPDVRLKHYLEMRGADAGPWRRICALPALWTGLLYDDDAFAEAEELVSSWSAQDREDLARNVPRDALHTLFRGRPVTELAGQVLKIAARGLAARAETNGYGESEEIFLSDIGETIAAGRSPAQRLLDAYAGPWQGDINRLFRELAYY